MNEIMNERIKKLANHAGFDFGRDWQIIGLNDYSLKTYTELLIRECANVIFKKVGPKSALDVLNHFGIEDEN